MAEYLETIQTVLPNFSQGDYEHSFESLGIDSIDLVALRVEMERILGKNIPDKTWTSFTTMEELVGYVHNSSGSAERPNLDNPSGVSRSIKVNMPEMALGGLSENWLLKEIGSIHWGLLCEGLGKDSDRIVDEMGNRLYATFVRIKYEMTTSLCDVMENEELSINGGIVRFGNSLYFSDIDLQSESSINAINAKLMTSFSRRDGEGNKSLVKSQPSGPGNSVREVSAMPEFGTQYRLLKKEALHTLQLKGQEFRIREKTIFTTEYRINPYYDLNGVGLLYFAAYPIIADYCEALYAEANLKLEGEKWEQHSSTQGRDILYYANCDIHETIVYRLHTLTIDGQRVKSVSSLHRKSDGQIMARITTLKVRKS